MTDANITIGIKADTTGARVIKRELNTINTAQTKTQSSSKRLTQSFNTQATASSRLGGALKGLSAAYALRQLQQVVDGYTNIQNRLKLVTDSTEELKNVTAELFDISNSTRLSYTATAEVYARTALATKDLGKSQAETLQFTKSLNQAVVLSGASAQESSAGLIQLSQGLASGALRGDELRSVLEQLPAVADVIAKGLNITRGELREMGTQGKITADIIFDSFTKAEQQLAEDFANTVPTIGQAFVVLKNNVTEFVGELDATTGASATVADSLIAVANNIETVTTVLATAAGGWVAYRAATLAATGATILAAVAGNVTAFIQLAATVRSLQTATALLNATFLIGPGALIAALGAAATWYLATRDNATAAETATLNYNTAIGENSKRLDEASTASKQRVSFLIAEQRQAIKSAQAELALARARLEGAKAQARQQNLRVSAATRGAITGSTPGQSTADIAVEARENAIDVLDRQIVEQELTLGKLAFGTISLPTVTTSTTATSASPRATSRSSGGGSTVVGGSVPKAGGIAQQTEAAEVLKETVQDAKTEVDDLNESVDKVRESSDFLADQAVDAFGSIIDGSKSSKEALKDLADSGREFMGDLLQDIQTTFLDSAKGSLGDLFKTGLGSVFGTKSDTAGDSTGGASGVFGSVLSGAGASLGSLFGFNSGGSMVLGGTGGTDNNVLSLNGSPIARTNRGEVLSFSPGQRDGGGGSGVTVNQTINVSTGVVETVRAEITGMLPDIQRSTEAAVREANLRGFY